MRNFLLVLSVLAPCLWANAAYYKLITSTDELTAGSKYIIVSSGTAGAAFAMGDQSKNNRTAVSVTIGSDLTVTTTNVAVLTLGGDATNGWTFYDPNNSTPGYLYAASGSNNYLRTQSTVDANSKADITITNNAVNIKFKGTNSRNILQYNSTSSLFSCYAGTQKSVYLLKEANASSVATPTFTPAAGTYNDTQSVSIACTTADATIHYTTDGTEPTAESPVYSAPITVDKSTTIKAIAIKGENSSSVATASYVIEIAAPAFSVAGGNYTTTQSVEITSATPGAAIYYTTDGNEPTSASTLYSGAISIDKTTTLKAIAIKNNVSSETSTASYIFANVCNTVAQFYDIASGATATINCPLTVVHSTTRSGSDSRTGKYLFVTDGTSCLCIFGTTGQTYKEGDIIPAGIKGTMKNFHGTTEMIPDASSFQAATESTDKVMPKAILASEAQVTDMNRYVIIRSCKLNTSTAKLTDSKGNEFMYFNLFDDVTIPTDGNCYDVYGFISSYTSSESGTASVSSLEINPTTFILDPTTGVSNLSDNGINVMAKDGTIFINGNAQSISVFNTSGVIVSRDRTEVNCAPGLYIIKVDSKVVKVMVK